ncbi:hypothetical protein AK812_SmicGene43082 [Symbiodinium microadriaticum]|uniref:Uncharacterized protein n=1 Tax=Symbiodinium microadriaticum TaxID=2951 RepID=A0A1Q9C1Y2_SYMMI|nr:hypothetical protein AK812_SmicGene43082 [Symbiodinium microadriaticum]CAE7414525.1 unnamed protein product [Symbiodinium microadriaticum]
MPGALGDYVANQEKDVKGLMIAMGFGMSASGPLLDMLDAVEEAVRRESLTPEARAWDRALKSTGVHGGATCAGGLQAGGRASFGGSPTRRRCSVRAVEAAAAELGLQVALKETPDPERYPEFDWSLRASSRRHGTCAWPHLAAARATERFRLRGLRGSPLRSRGLRRKGLLVPMHKDDMGPSSG